MCIADPKRNNQTSLSPQQLLSCETNTQRGCLGGDTDTVWQYIETWGLFDENQCAGRYRGFDHKKLQCKTVISNCHNGGFKAHKGSSHCVLQSEKSIKHEILLSGPVVGLMFLYDDFFVYKDGVYAPMATANPVMTAALQQANRNAVQLAVKIIGWGMENGLDYWLIENSYGREWGQNGYAKILRSGKEDEFSFATYNPARERDIILLEPFTIWATPMDPRLEEDDIQEEEKRRAKLWQRLEEERWLWEQRQRIADAKAADAVESYDPENEWEEGGGEGEGDSAGIQDVEDDGGAPQKDIDTYMPPRYFDEEEDDD